MAEDKKLVERKKQTKMENGIKYEKFEGDTFWVVVEKK